MSIANEEEYKARGIDRAALVKQARAAWKDAAIGSIERAVLDEMFWIEANDDMASGCLAEIRDTLKAIGCSHGAEAHAGTPPMFYPEWIRCCLHKVIMDTRAGIDRTKPQEEIPK